MSKHDLTPRMCHMLEHAREAADLVKGKQREELDSDRLLNLALVRLVEIVGEAAARVPKEDWSAYPQIPWAQIVSLRNRLIHGYDAVDFDILWQIVTRDLPDLISALEKILSSKKP
jgi:uncharacterized protein with HEPN domain